jgi:flavin reductase (DIM6/NTAB) family NADH-FMN oxidoreductase RutF
MKTLKPNETDPIVLQNYLQSAVSPRPIAWVSTINLNGEINLAPFSFFNIFGINPPILIFSPNNRLRDGSTKHTLENVIEVPEAVVHMVSYDMVNQMSLTSSEFNKGINEFEKAGLNTVKSTIVKPPRISLAPLSMECKVLEIKSMGAEKGKTNLIICEVVLVHISDDLLDKNGHIDMLKTDWVARGGGNYYIRANNFFEIPKPNTPAGVGVDGIAKDIKQRFSGNELGLLGLINEIPDQESVESFRLQHLEADYIQLTKVFLLENQLTDAWKALLCIGK